MKCNTSGLEEEIKILSSRIEQKDSEIQKLEDALDKHEAINMQSMSQFEDHKDKMQEAYEQNMELLDQIKSTER